MTDPQIAIFMLGIFILVIMLGFPIAFTLMAMGIGFGYYAYYDPERMHSIFDNRIFDLFVNQTYSVMSNDVLTAVPLFLFMGYIVERANIVDRLFFTLNIAARRLPGSMAVAALATCALFATATGIVGAVVTLMGLLAFPAMLKARYDTSFAAGVICAGGCLGILIPPSIMLIVYGAAAQVSVVKLYAGAMLPGLLLAGLYMLYVIGRATLQPSVAPKPRDEEIGDLSSSQVAIMMLTSFAPLALLILSVLGAILFGLATPSEAAAIGALGGIVLAIIYRIGAFTVGAEPMPWANARWGSNDTLFYTIGWGVLAATAITGVCLILYKISGTSLSPHELGLRPGMLIGLALVLSLLQAAGLTRRLEPSRQDVRRMIVFAGQGAVAGLFFGIVYLAIVLGLFPGRSVIYLGPEIGLYVTAVGFAAWRIMDEDRLRESVYLTVRTSAMVCWLFVGSWTFSSVFSYLGGEQLVKEFVLSLELTPLTFLIMTQIIIFLLGWPLEWSEIIIIFVPIFLPLLPEFGVDPLFFGILVALNLQTSFMTPPMAMSAYYLKGVSPPHVRLTQIFGGAFPFLAMVFLSIVLLYIFPGIALWLPKVFYG